MTTRKDQVQAYRFAWRRMGSALLAADPDAPQTPTRYLAQALLGGAMVAVLLLAGAGILGSVKGGRTQDWRKPGTIIIEKSSGARLMMLGDQALHPVLNFSSARLIAGGKGPVRTVPTAALGDTARGVPVGISDAPDLLPSPRTLLHGSWTLCARVPAADDASAPRVSLLVGARPAGTLIADGEALLLPTGPQLWLIWKGTRFEIDRRLAGALGLAPAPHGAGSTWLSPLPVGPRISTIAVKDAGHPFPGSADGRIGEVFKVVDLSGNVQYAVLTGSGLAPVSPFTAELILADPSTAAAYPSGTPAVREVSPSTAGRYPASAEHLDIPGLPLQIPRSHDPAGTTVCAVYPTGDRPAAPAILTVTDSAGVMTPGPGAQQPTADEVHVAPGHGAVVRQLPAPGVTSSTVYLVTELGVAYPLASADVAGTLGLPGQPDLVSEELIARLPVGPALDPAQATQQHPPAAP